MMKREVNFNIVIKIAIVIFVFALCIFFASSVYFSKPVIYYEASNKSKDFIEPKLVLNEESTIKQGYLPELSSTKTSINSPYKDNWITTNDAISKIKANNNNILSVTSIAPFNSSGQSFAYEILVSENSYIAKYVVTGDSNIKKEVTLIKSEKTKPFPVNVPDSSLAVKVISSNTYFNEKSLIGVAIYFDIKQKSWKYIIRTDAGDVSVPI